MSQQGGSSEEKTEKATPHKLKKARREGQISNSAEVGQWFGMLAASWMLPGVIRDLNEAGEKAMVQIGWIIRDPDLINAQEILSTITVAALKAIVPMCIVIALIGILGVAVQGGIYVAPKAVMPKAKKLNPLQGLKRMFGPQAAWQGIKMFLKCSALIIIVFVAVKDLIPTLYSSGKLQLSSILDVAASIAIDVLRYAAIAGIIMSIADFAVVKKRNNKQLKMSKSEVKQEYKQQDGDPLFKSARRSKALAMSQGRMMAAVPDADVVLVNPTHVAVALKYEAGKGAPRVLAKGADQIAARIRRLAEENRIPMVRDVPLARSLYAHCDIGQEIPESLFQTVATVLAFVMTLKSKGSAAGTHRVPAAAKA